MVTAILVLACGINIDTGNTGQIDPTLQPPQIQPTVPVILATYTIQSPVQPTYTPQPTFTPLPTYTSQPTYTSVPTQVQEATFTANEAAFCRKGPSEQVWWDPQEALKAGQTVKILGKSSEEWGLWWYIEKASGSRCWVYSELGSTAGNVSGVPLKTAPNTPVPTVVNVTLKNNHGGPLCGVWITNSGQGNWVNLLEGWQLEVGQFVQFTAWPGNYDIEMYDCANNFVDADYGMLIDSNNHKFTTP